MKPPTRTNTAAQKLSIESLVSKSSSDLHRDSPTSHPDSTTSPPPTTSAIPTSTMTSTTTAASILDLPAALYANCYAAPGLISTYIAAGLLPPTTIPHPSHWAAAAAAAAAAGLTQATTVPPVPPPIPPPIPTFQVRKLSSD